MKSQATVLDQPDVETLAVGASVATTGRVAGRILALLSQVVLARFLGPTSFGLYALGLTTLRIVGQYAPLGLDKGVIRFGGLHWGTNERKFRGAVLQSLFLAFILGAVSSIAVYMLAPWLAESVFGDVRLTDVLRGFSLALPLVSCLRVAAAATTVSKRTSYYVKAQELLQPALELALILGFLTAGFRIAGAIGATILSLAVALFVALRYISRLFPEVFKRGPRPSNEYWRLLKFSIPVSLAGLLSTIMAWGDRYLVAIFRPTADVGIYQAASQSAMLSVIILSGINMIFTPMIVDYFSNGRMEDLQHLYRVATKWALYLSLPFFLVTMMLPEDIMVAIFGQRFAEGALPLVVLATGQLVNVGTGAVGVLLVMTGRPNQWTVLSGLMLATNLVLGVVLIPTHGLVGAAISTATAVGGRFIVGLMMVQRSLGLWPYDLRYMKGLLASGLALVPLVIIKDLESLLPLVRLVVGGITCGGLFVASLVLLRLEAEDRQLLRSLGKALGEFI